MSNIPFKLKPFRYLPIFWKVSIFIIFSLLLILGFYQNQWKTAGEMWFFDWRENNDVYVLGRLVWSRQAGVFADSGLLGLGDGQWQSSPGFVLHQTETYISNGAFKSYFTYHSQSGGQGVILSIIDKLTNYQPSINLNMFHGITSVLSAISIILIANWFWTEFNYLSAIFILLFSILSEWLTLYGGSLFFQLWTFYLPFIAVAYYFLKKNEARKLSSMHLISISAFTILIKIFFNGFDFITVVLGMQYVPVFYYVLYRRWGGKALFFMFTKILIGQSIAILLGLTILFAQISSALESNKNALQHILNTFAERTIGETSNLSMTNNTSLSAPSIVWKYISEGRAINDKWAIPGLSRFIESFEIRYFHIFELFIFVSLAIFLMTRIEKLKQPNKKTLSLLWTSWFSLIPPLSWLIIFKEHSYNHFHLNYIIWQMPFTFFVFALCGMGFESVFKSFFWIKRA
ncbi:MAG: hypothetical protein QGD88_07925 [Anaerolineae bacterium]|nr:hypothetical protein [Anaerolineae bacterium]